MITIKSRIIFLDAMGIAFHEDPLKTEGSVDPEILYVKVGGA